MQVELNFLPNNLWVYYNPVHVLDAFETKKLGVCLILSGPARRLGILSLQNEQHLLQRSGYLRCNYFIAESGVVYIESFVLTAEADLRFPTIKLKKQLTVV